ncbi:hypothetical protein LJC57_02100 [Parabacteroides sp. OttesenSCG-928-G07]|nr:hypothetical protein [Parabacteroides sp. OttesenSCG-928-G21]MDL2277361.1 hypothetical protein [Parabacteroides sp. OttesenSCG-928-G07]
MKKKLIMLLTMAIAFVSCEGPEGPPGRDGIGVNKFVEVVTVEAHQWEYVDDPEGGYYICEKRFPEISGDIYLKGEIKCYYIIRPGQSNEAQTPLPYVLHFIDGSDYRWTETIEYDFMPNTSTADGSIAFYVQYDDFAINVPPGRMQFRVVITW